MTITKWKNHSENGRANSPVLFNSPIAGLIEDFFGDGIFGKEYATYVPAVNISEEDSLFTLELSAPGFDKNDFKIEIGKGTLNVSGTHKTEKEEKGKTFSRKEFNYGSFHRSFSLPGEINEELIEASYDNGILKIKLPKKQAEKTVKEIKIS